VCMYVCPSMHSNCGHFRAELITYTESVLPGGAALAIHSSEKWPVAKIPKKGYAANAFLWENFVL
jgi:hypothetical protein